tara:strand:+ start:144 stop:392 length:249 start_codon:yes stop_codon:yes gene_type:complete
MEVKKIVCNCLQVGERPSLKDDFVAYEVGIGNCTKIEFKPDGSYVVLYENTTDIWMYYVHKVSFVEFEHVKKHVRKIVDENT